MVDAVKSWLSQGPYIQELSVCSLAPGSGTGLFPKGISRVRQDILGRSRLTQSYILRHRDYPDATWVEQVSAWVLQNQPEQMKVTPQGGKPVNPTKDGWGTWELELKVES